MVTSTLRVAGRQRLVLACTAALLAAALWAGAAMPETVNFWPWRVLRKQPDNTLERASAAGPILEQTYTGQTRWAALRPLAIRFERDETRAVEEYFLYPLFTRHRYPGRDSWSVFSLMHGSQVGGDGIEPATERFSLFPFYFSKQTGDPETSYRGLLPLGGKIQLFLHYDTFTWTLFPLYARLEKGEARRHALPWPFIQWQEGGGSSGWALWPLLGHFEEAGKSRYSYLLWPLLYRHEDQWDKGLPRVREGFLPFYARVDSENVQSRTYVWPFFGWTEQQHPAYSETRYFWPLFVQGRGERKYINRWAPFFSHSDFEGRKKTWLLWPLFKRQRWDESGLELTQDQLLYFVFWRQTQHSLSQPHSLPAERTTLWPLFTYWNNGAGRSQFQALSLFEPFFPHNEVVRAQYSPLFSVIRQERWPDGHIRSSLLWDALVHEQRPDSGRLQLGPLLDIASKGSEHGPRLRLLGGLFGIEGEPGERTLTLLWNDVGSDNAQAPSTQRKKFRR